MNLFYLPDLQPDDVFTHLNEEESAHCCRVLRLKEGNKILITNGKGWMFTAEIILSDFKYTEVKIIDKQCLADDSGFSLHIAMAPTKNIARFEWFLEKACEIGVGKITPLICTHSERQKLNLERLERILIAAMKQSQTTILPVLNPPCDLKKFVTTCQSEQKFFGWCGAQTQGDLFDLVKKNMQVVVLIGPEGDFSNDEFDLLQKNGYIPVSMGTQRLRTETAGLVACCTVSLKNRIL